MSQTKGCATQLNKAMPAANFGEQMFESYDFLNSLGGSYPSLYLFPILS